MRIYAQKKYIIINVCFCLSNYLHVEETWNCRLELLFYQRERERESLNEEMKS